MSTMIKSKRGNGHVGGGLPFGGRGMNNGNRVGHGYLSSYHGYQGYHGSYTNYQPSGRSNWSWGSRRSGSGEEAARK